MPSVMSNPTGAPPQAPGAAPVRHPVRWRQLLRTPLRAAAWLLAPPLAVILVALAVHAYRTDPRDARALVEHELRAGVLEPGETVREEARVVLRRPMDYFRATRGLLVLTDRRLLFVGLVPRDFASPENEPDAFDQREYPIDTAVAATTTRAMLGTHRALALRVGSRRDVFPVMSVDWARAEAILSAIDSKQAAQRAAAEADRQARLAAAQRALQPIYHVVQRGEALSSIADRYGIPLDRLRQLNHLTSDRIRAGDSLLIKPKGVY